MRCDGLAKKDKVWIVSLIFLCVLNCRRVGRESPVAVNISNSERDANHPAIAVDPFGNVHVVWMEGLGTEEEIFYAMKSADSDDWTSPMNISNNSRASRFPTIAADNDGNVHIAWQDASPYLSGWKIFYVVKLADGTWSIPETLFPGNVAAPKLVIDDMNNVHIIFERLVGGITYEVYYAMKPPDGIWTAPVNLSNTPDGQEFRKDIAVDGHGNVYVVWESDCTFPEHLSDIFYTMRSTDGVWTTPINLSQTYEPSSNPSITADPSNNIHIVWKELGGDLAYMTIIPFSNHTQSQAFTIFHNATFPVIGSDREGNLHLVWQQYKYENHLWYAKKTKDGWTTPIRIYETQEAAAYPDIAVDINGYVHVVWRDCMERLGNHDIYYTCIK